jgi:hypothetical protein
MALLEQVKDERKIETKRERRKLLSSGQVSRRGWNIKFSVEFTAGRKLSIVILTLYFLSLFLKFISSPVKK